MKAPIRYLNIPPSAPKEISFYLAIILLGLVVCVNLFNLTYLWMLVVCAVLVPCIFTYCTGLFFVRIFRFSAFDQRGQLYKIVSLSLIGLAINGFLFLLIGFLGVFTKYTLITYLAAVVLAYVIRNRHSSHRFNMVSLVSHNILPLITVIAFSLAIAIWFQPISSYPNLAGWDVYTDMLTVRHIIIHHGISELNLRYLPTFHYYYAVECIFLNLDPYVIYWGSIYFIFPVAGASLYLLGWKLSGNKLVGIATGIFGITIGSTNEVLGFIFPYPSTFALIITIFANTILFSGFSRKFMILYILVASLTYQFALAANFIILVGVLGSTWNRRQYCVLLVIAVSTFVFGLYAVGSVLPGAGRTNLSTDQIVKIMSASYVGLRGLILVILGIFFLFIFGRPNRKIMLILTSTLITFGVIVSGFFNLGYRLEEFIRPYIAFIIGFGIGSFSMEFPRIILKKEKRSKR